MKKYKLKNGLQVILTPQKETKAVTVLVLVGVGSRYETKNITGMSHFLEHMLFKGTKQRPTTLSLSRELDSVGAEYNFFTTKDHTGLYVKINSEHLELALVILSDVVFNSKFEEKELKREKGTIMEEFNMYDDMPMTWAEVLMEEVMYKGNGLAHDQLGSKEDVKSTTRSKMLNYKNKHYFPSNMLVSIAGSIDNKGTKKVVEKYFGNNLKNNKQVKFNKFNVPNTLVEKNILGTGGAIKNAESYIHSKQSIILNGDTFVDINYPQLIDWHNDKGSEITLVINKIDDPSRYGLVNIDNNNKIKSFIEKKEGLKSGWINSGVYIINNSVLKSLAKGEYFSLEKDLFPKYLNKSFFAYKNDGTMIDIGTPESYLESQSIIHSFSTKN